MGRIQGLAESGILSENQIVKSLPGYVFSITLAYAGAAAGNRCYLRDGILGNSPIEVVFILDAAQGTMHFDWPQGKEFTSGIYWDQGDAVGSDKIFATMTYK